MLPKDMKFLVVEDSTLTRHLLVKFLKDRGYANTRGAASGELALKLMHEEPADCVISDYDMHGMNGVELLERIKQDPAIQHAHVIIMSGGMRDEAREKAMALGAFKCLHKPVWPELLLKDFEEAMAPKES